MLRIWRNNQLTQVRPNFWDGMAFAILILIFAFLAFGAKQMSAPYQVGETLAIHLSPEYLPYYALRTVLRMLVAMLFSLFFTFTVGALAAKNRHAERLIIPAIDVLQSVPILGFLSITVVGFIALFPHSILGPECAAIFAIFTSQVWNMTLGFYQNVKTVPHDLQEASRMFHLSSWQRFWRIDVPFALPGLVWNMMMSMSAGWFFVVASEAITVNHQSILLPGIGSYIATAIYQANKIAVLYAILTMLVVVLLYDQLLFRPLVHWSERFKFEASINEKKSFSLLVALLQRARIFGFFSAWVAHLFYKFTNIGRHLNQSNKEAKPVKRQPYFTWITLSFYYGMVFLFCLLAVLALGTFIFKSLSLAEIPHVLLLGVYTGIRVFVLIILCSIVWVPIGVWVGMRPLAKQIIQPVAQFFAAFPANLFFPVVVIVIIKFNLNVQIWTTPLMILGTQWYILFNVIAGTANLPKELYLVTQNLGVSGWLWWKRFILPGIFPFYITGAMAAAGGAWNASIVAEVVTWGSHTLEATGLGAYIATYTSSGQFPKIALGISVMCLYVLIINRVLWQPLYHLAQKRFQLY